MSKTLIIILGLIALAILGYFCIYKHSPDIQKDIDVRTHAALTAEGLEQVGVDADGRDIMLSGEVASEEIRRQAEENVRSVHGVRTVDNQLTVLASEPIVKPVPVPELELELEPEPIKEVIQPPKLEELPEYTCQQDFNALLSNNNINFATNSAEIDTSSNSLLSELIEVAKQCPEARIEIGGHTDSRGSDEYNLNLSQARASSVMSYLINNGVEASRLSAVGYGETNPIADNESEAGLAKNRRIEFNIKGLSQ